MVVEIRADKSSMAVSGYVNVVGRDSRELRDASGTFTEQIAPGTFAKALQTGNTVELRFNHKSTLDDTNGSLTLKEDNVGLKAECIVTDAAVIEAAEAGELRGWSFGFVCNADSWETREDGKRHRTVTDLELREVSILNKTPAYIATSIETREDGDALCEYRAEIADTDVSYKTTTDREVKETTVIDSSDGYTSETETYSRIIEIYKVKRR